MYIYDICMPAFVYIHTYIHTYTLNLHFHAHTFLISKAVYCDDISTVNAVSVIVTARKNKV